MISQDNLTVATVIASRLHGISPGSDDAESANRRYYNDKSPVLVATVKSPRTRAHVEAPTRVVLASGGAFVSPFSSGEHHPANLERQRERERERERERMGEWACLFFNRYLPLDQCSRLGAASRSLHESHSPFLFLRTIIIDDRYLSAYLSRFAGRSAPGSFRFRFRALREKRGTRLSLARSDSRLNPLKPIWIIERVIVIGSYDDEK